MATQLKIAITGADGFVGRHACRLLRSVGHEVLELHGPADGPDAVDITNPSPVVKRIEAGRPDAVLHLAGISSVAQSHHEPQLAFRVNTIGTVNLLEAVRRAVPHARVLCVSSGEVYGAVPAPERAQEGRLCVPTSPYGASKVAAEVAAQQYQRAYGLHVIVARPFNHLGAGQHPNFVVPSFASQLEAIRRGGKERVLKVGNLEPVRDFLHVEDVIAAYRLLLEKGEPGATYNICSGEPKRIRELLDELIRLSGTNAKVAVDASRLRPAEIPWLVGDCTRLEALGWRRQKSVGDALRDVLAEVQGQ